MEKWWKNSVKNCWWKKFGRIGGGPVDRGVGLTVGEELTGRGPDFEQERLLCLYISTWPVEAVMPIYMEVK